MELKCSDSLLDMKLPLTMIDYLNHSQLKIYFASHRKLEFFPAMREKRNYLKNNKKHATILKKSISK